MGRLSGLAALLLYCSCASAAPVRIVCNGSVLDPITSRPAVGGVTVFGFEFDQADQTMALIEGAPARTALGAVAISDNLARGSTGRWLFEVNRIDGVLTIRTDPSGDTQSARTGITGNYFKGVCAPPGAAKF